MAANCVFCRIIAGDEPASVVLDSDRVLAFMDIRQFHAGHVLVVPKDHIDDIYALDALELAGELLSAVAIVARAVRDLIEPDGTNVWQSNGAGAGQEVFHVHFHVVPRFKDDGLLRVYPSKPGYPPREELDQLAVGLRGAIPR